MALCLVIASGDCACSEAEPRQRGGHAQHDPVELEGVDVLSEHLGGPLPRDATFRDTEGKAVKLGDYFDGKRPTVFVFAYHTCPMLCSLVLDVRR